MCPHPHLLPHPHPHADTAAHHLAHPLHHNYVTTLVMPVFVFMSTLIMNVLRHEPVCLDHARGRIHEHAIHERATP